MYPFEFYKITSRCSKHKEDKNLKFQTEKLSRVPARFDALPADLVRQI